MWSWSLCIQICSILRMSISRNMGEVQEITGVKDIVKLNSFKTKSLKWLIEKPMEAILWKGFNSVIPLLEELEVDLGLTCLKDSMIIILKRSFRHTQCSQTAMMLSSNLITVFFLSKDWLWMQTLWSCLTTRLWIELQLIDWSYFIPHLSKSIRLYQQSWLHRRQHFDTLDSWTMTWWVWFQPWFQHPAATF